MALLILLTVIADGSFDLVAAAVAVEMGLGLECRSALFVEALVPENGGRRGQQQRENQRENDTAPAF